MPSENGEAYVIRDTDDDVWARPTPVRTAVLDVVVEESHLSREDIADLDEYVDVADLHAILSADDGAVELAIEDCKVRVTADGDIDVLA